MIYPLGKAKSNFKYFLVNRLYAFPMIFLVGLFVSIGTFCILYKIAQQINHVYKKSDSKFSFRLSNVISQVKDAFSRFYASLPRPPKKHDIRRDLTEQIPFLRKEIRDRNDKISQIVAFVQKHPDLLAMSVKAWVEFAPKSSKLIKLEEYEPLDILEKTSYLRRRIINCDRVLNNYKRFLWYNPEIKKLFKRYLLPQPPQITG